MQNLFFNPDEYANLTDEQIVDLTRKGNKEALNYLIDKYTELVSMKVSKYFIVGAERDDIMQEGLIGLLKLSSVILKKNKLHLKLLLIFV